MLASLFVCHSKWKHLQYQNEGFFYLAATCLCLLITLLPVNCCLGDQEYGHFTSVHEWCFVDPWIARIPQDDTMTWHDMTWHDMTWHDMTWHDMTWHDISLIVFEEEKPWLVVGDMYFSWYDPYHPWSCGVFSASTFLIVRWTLYWWLSFMVWSWFEAAREMARSGSCSSSLSDVMLPLPWVSVRFLTRPQSQWSMQDRLFDGCEHSNWPTCKSLGRPNSIERNSAFGFWLLNQCQSFLVKYWSGTNYI